MFFVTVTKREQQVTLPGVDCTVFRRGTWNIMLGASSNNTQVTVQGNGFSLVESPLAGVSPSPAASVALTADASELQVTKPLFSGRPIYFHQNPAGDFFCGTHMAALRACGVRLEADDAALPEYLLYRYLVPPSTLYKSVGQLPLGARLRVRLTPGRSEMDEIEYWSAPKPSSSPPPEELGAALVRCLRARFQKLIPVKSQLAVLLSGGLDSTTLFRSAQTIFEIPETYSTGFPFTQDDGNVEQQYAESAAAALGVRHQYYQSTGEDYLRGLLPAIAAAEAPVHHLQSVLLWLLFKRGLGQDKTIVVSGEGADGIFGVDLQRRFWRRENKPALLSLFSAPPLAAAARWLTEATGRGRGVFEPALEALPGDDYENPDHELWSMSCHGKRERVLEQFECDKGDLFRSRLALVNHIKNRSAYDVISLLGLMGEATITQTIWSQMGERCGRFVDYPFLDPELLQFAFQTSWKDKLREPKWLIRAALRHLKVPEFIIRRPKSSFGLNRRGWALKNGMLEPLVPLAAKVFPERQIRSLQTQDESEASVFWALLNYALWRRLCVDGEPLETLQEELEQQIQDAKPAMDNALIRN